MDGITMEKLHVLVCVTGQKTCEKLIAEGAKLAEELGADLSVVHVARQGDGLLGGDVAEDQALEYLFQISSEYGAGMTVIRSDNVVSTLVKHARKVDASMMVLGSPPRRSGRDVVRELREHMPDMELHIVYTNE